MAQFIDKLKSKINLSIITIILIYLFTLTLVFVLLLPLRQQATDLTEQIANEKMHQESLLRVINRRPSLKKQYETVVNSIKELERSIPTQRDFPIILQTIEDLADNLFLENVNLDYNPLQSSNDKLWIPVKFEAEGSFAALAKFIKHLEKEFVSLELYDVRFESSEKDTLFLTIAKDVFVIPNKWETQAEWQHPETFAVNSRILEEHWGVPASLLQQFHNGNIKLLGIVTADDYTRALVVVEGKERWIQVGDSISVGKVTDINSERMVVDVRGVELVLKIGG